MLVPAVSRVTDMTPTTQRAAIGRKRISSPSAANIGAQSGWDLLVGTAL